MKSAVLVSSILATVPAFAQVTGEYGRRMMHGGGTGATISMILTWALFVGVTFLVWLWVAKLWRELRKKK